MNESLRKKRIDELLHIIGGSEVVLRSELAKDDYKLKRTVQKTQKEKLKELRAVIYGVSLGDQK